jgi:hypothetical protein
MVGLKDIYDQVILMAQQQAMFTGKMDGFISTWNSQVDIISREIKRIEADAQRTLADHEARIRELKAATAEIQGRPVVTPKAVWGAVGAFSGVVSIAVAIIAIITR